MGTSDGPCVSHVTRGVSWCHRRNRRAQTLPSQAELRAAGARAQDRLGVQRAGRSRAAGVVRTSATRALAWSRLFVLNGDTGCGRGRGQRGVDRSQTAFFPLRRRPVTPLSIPQGTKEGARLGAGGPLRPLWLGTGSQSTPSPEEFLAEFPTRLVAVFILRNEASPCARTYRCRQDRQVEDGAEAGLPGRSGRTATQLCPCAGPLPRVRVAASVTRVAVYPSFSASLYLGIDHVCSCTCLSPWPAV